MPEYAALKQPPGEVAKNRNVHTEHFRLNKRQRARLDRSSLALVFSQAFLTSVLERSSPRRTVREIYTSGDGALSALRSVGIENFKQLREASWEKIAGARGIGVKSFALVLDVLQLFGYVPEHDDTPVEPPEDGEEEVQELLEFLGIRNYFF